LNVCNVNTRTNQKYAEQIKIIMMITMAICSNYACPYISMWKKWPDHWPFII